LREPSEPPGTGPGAKFIDDNHFSGPGVLKVRRDGNPDGLMLILR